jgi:hypothetical protein
MTTSKETAPMRMLMLLTNRVEQPSGHVTLVLMPIILLPSAHENKIGSMF